MSLFTKEQAQGAIKIAKISAWIIGLLWTNAGGVWFLFRHHVDTYVQEQARIEVWGNIATALGNQDNGDPHTVESAQKEIIWQVKNGHVRDMLFKSMSDSLKPYEPYLRFVQKATPEGVLHVNGIDYWFTGKRDKYGEPIKFKVRKREGYTGRWYLDDQDQWNLLWDHKHKPQQ